MANMGMREAALALAVAMLLAVALPAAAGPKGSADIQWAQQVLKERGFDAGRPNGEMTARTRAALAGFQRSVGLPASGELDPATVERLMSGRPSAPTVGLLGLPQHSPRSGAAEPAVSGPPVHHAAPHASASASARVDAVADGDSAPMLGAGGPMVRGTANGLSNGPSPRAAPSGTVSTVAAPLLPGQAASEGVANRPADDDRPLQIVAPTWVRTVVVGVIAAILGGFILLWWLGGRYPGRRRLSQGHQAGRHEPRFDAGGRAGHDLRARRLG